MIVKQITEELYDYRQGITIEIDNESVFSAWDGEPEDNNLCRNFSDCYHIVGMMLKAYEAGKNGESWELVKEKIKEDE